MLKSEESIKNDDLLRRMNIERIKQNSQPVPSLEEIQEKIKQSQIKSNAELDKMVKSFKSKKPGTEPDGDKLK